MAGFVTANKTRLPGLIDRLGPADLAIPIFVLATLAFEEGHIVNAGAKVLLVGVFVLDVLAGRRPRLTPFLIASAAFLVLSTASLAWTVSQETSSARVATFAFQLASYVALVNLILWRPIRLELALTWVILGAIASGVSVVLIQGVTFQDQRSVEGVIPAGQLAIGCAAGIAVSVYRFSRTRRWRYVAAVAVMATFLTMTSGRRGFIVAVLFVAGYHFLSARRFDRKLRAVATGAGMLAGAYLLVMNNSFFYGHIGYRLESFFDFLSGNSVGDASVQGRSWIINAGMDLFHQSPLIGNGVDSFGAQFQNYHGSWSTSADNNYVQLLADLGIVGLLAYYVPLAIFIVGGLRAISRKPADVQFAVALVLAISAVDFATVQVFSKVGMLMIALCATTVYLWRQDAMERKSEAAPTWPVRPTTSRAASLRRSPSRRPSSTASP